MFSLPSFRRASRIGCGQPLFEMLHDTRPSATRQPTGKAVTGVAGTSLLRAESSQQHPGSGSGGQCDDWMLLDALPPSGAEPRVAHSASCLSLDSPPRAGNPGMQLPPLLERGSAVMTRGKHGNSIAP